MSFQYLSPLLSFDALSTTPTLKLYFVVAKKPLLDYSKTGKKSGCLRCPFRIKQAGLLQKQKRDNPSVCPVFATLNSILVHHHGLEPWTP